MHVLAVIFLQLQILKTQGILLINLIPDHVTNELGNDA